MKDWQLFVIWLFVVVVGIGYFGIFITAIKAIIIIWVVASVIALALDLRDEYYRRKRENGSKESGNKTA